MDPIQAGLATLFASGTLTGLSDIELLERLASRGDLTAFEVLVGRHARLVMNVCRGLLADPNDADDAFQATFLVLARKAGSIRAGDSLASWLCRVAYRIAVRAGAESTRRRQAERRGAEQNAARTASKKADRPGTDEIAILLDELDRLPERYRVPIVLCHLEGLSTDAAARRLGCPVGTIWARLSRARARLRSRLVRRGVSLSAAALAAEVFPPVTQAAVSSELLQTTIRSSLRYLTLDALAAGVTSARALAWTDAALRAMLHAKLKAAATIVLTVGALATIGAGVLAQVQRQASQPASPVAGSNEDIGRTIHFPGDRAVGIIYVLDTDEHDLAAIRGYDRWQRISEARGVVRLPARGLVRLDLSRSAVSDLSPLQQVDPQAIQVLHLRDLGARDDTLRHISHFKGLLRLDLRGNFFTGRSLEHIAMMHDLLSLELGDTTIGDDGIRQIAQLKSLRAIDLGRSRITDRSLELLGSMSRLESLNLYQTSITDRGVAHLVGLKNLRYLRISDTNTTNVALEHVAKLENLDHFEFDDTRVTDSGLAFLAGLKKLKSIRASNPFSDAGLAHLARLPALEDLTAGNGTRFTDRGLAYLCQCQSLKIVHLGGSDHFTDEGLFHLAKLPRLENLSISGRASREPRSAPAITDRGMTSLRRIKTLKRLVLRDCRIGGAGLVSLSHLPALEALGLAETSLTFEDLRQFAGFHNLKDFRLYTVAADAGRPTLRAFRLLASLEWLRLPDNADARGAGNAVDFEPAEFANLSGLTKLKTLEYSGRLADAGLKHLAPLTAMDNLDIRNADVTDDGLRYLSGMKDLNYLTIGGRITDEGLRHLAELQSLRVLQLNTRTVSWEGVKWLWERLPSLQMVPGFDDLHPLIVGQRINYTKIGENAPEFSVMMRDGNSFRLADHRGKVVLVHFWGPKCAPCIRAMPKLRALHQELSGRPDRFAMISITAGMEDRDWQAFLDDHAMDWPQALLSGDDLKLWADFHVRGIPDYGVIGPTGKIIADGESTGRDIDKLKATIIEAMER